MLKLYVSKVARVFKPSTNPPLKGMWIILTEQDIQNLIRVALTPIATVFRINTGKVKTHDGRYFSSGTPKGYSDLSGFRKSDGKAFFIEIKTPTGKLRPDQDHFLNQMSQYPVITGVARSAKEAVDIIENGSKYLN